MPIEAEQEQSAPHNDWAIAQEIYDWAHNFAERTNRPTTPPFIVLVAMEKENKLVAAGSVEDFADLLYGSSEAPPFRKALMMAASRIASEHIAAVLAQAEKDAAPSTATN